MSEQVSGFDGWPAGQARSVSLDRACRILGKSRRTIYYWIKDGRLHTVRTTLGSQRVLTESVMLAPHLNPPRPPRVNEVHAEERMS